MTFSKAIDDISRSLHSEIQAELDHRKDVEYQAYRHARESEVQNRLSRYRYEREAELRDELEAVYETDKKDWTERLDLEFKSREAAARKAIMSELDAQLRNERLTHETDLDLLKEETTLELEIEMEERLTEFKTRKETEVATQLERQLDKREEIMRNKALIDVRKREAQIRAEIEAQLGLKRAEIRDRLKGLSEKMDSFKEMAEEKMREAVTQQIQDDIDVDEAELKAREREYTALQSTDTRAEKRQKWMQSISGQAPASLGAAATDPSALGARPDGLGAAAGRPLRGLMGQQTTTEPRLGLGGMRSPMTSAKPLTAPAPPVRTVRQPIGQAAGLPAARTIRQPIGAPAPLVPQEDQAVQPDAEADAEATLEDPALPEPVQDHEEFAPDEVEDTAEDMPSSIEEEMDELLDEEPLDDALEDTVADPVDVVEAETQLDQAPEAMEEGETDAVEPVIQLDEAPDAMETPQEADGASDDALDEADVPSAEPTAALRPIRGVLAPSVAPEPPATASITPVGTTLIPAEPADQATPATAMLRPVKGTLTPVSKTPVKTLQPQEDED